MSRSRAQETLGRAPRQLRSEEGFTLVELLITTILLTVVLGATLTAFDVFQRQASANSQRGDVQSGIRTELDQIASTLRSSASYAGGAVVERAGADDLVVQVVDPSNSSPPGANAGDLMRVRYCLDTSNMLNVKLRRWTWRWTIATPPPLPNPPTACTLAALPGSPWDPTPKLIAEHVAPIPGTPPAFYDDPTRYKVFTYGPAGPSPLSAIADVQVALGYLDRSPKPVVATANRLVTDVSLRNVKRPPVIALTCSALGGGQALCDSWGTTDPDGQTLTFAWSFGTSCASLTPISGATTAQVTKGGLTPGTSYCFGLTVTNLSGMSAQTTRTVTPT